MLSESIYEDAADFRDAGPDFGARDARAVFAELTVYVEFDTTLSERRMLPIHVPGDTGLWVPAYSSLRRLHLARGEDEIEYSAMFGAHVLAERPHTAGVWFDPCFPGGRPIVVPAPEVDWEL